MEEFDRHAARILDPCGPAILARCRALLAPADRSSRISPPRCGTGRPTIGRSSARALLAYGQWLRRQHRRTDARSRLRAAQEIFQRSGAGLWVARAQAELSSPTSTSTHTETPQLRRTASHPGTLPGQLSRSNRETEGEQRDRGPPREPIAARSFDPATSRNLPAKTSFGLGVWRRSTVRLAGDRLGRWVSALLDCMRYGDGGGVDQAERVRREQVRQRAAQLFADGKSALEVAALLEVSTKSAYQWRLSWAAGGAEALASKGPSGPDPKLSDEQLARLKARLDQGPAAAGYGEDQRWTLARVVALIATMFHLRVGITTPWQAMRRLGYTPQLPIHRAIDLDEPAIAHWRRYQWPAVEESPPDRPPGSALPTSAARR
jgi:putative transposase